MHGRLPATSHCHSAACLRRAGLGATAGQRPLMQRKPRGAHALRWCGLHRLLRIWGRVCSGCCRRGCAERGPLLCRGLHPGDVHLLYLAVPPLHHHHAHRRQRSQPAVRPSLPPRFSLPSEGGLCLPSRLRPCCTPLLHPNLHIPPVLTQPAVRCTASNHPVPSAQLQRGLPPRHASARVQHRPRTSSGPSALEAALRSRSARQPAGAVRPPA